jgi:uncharacterized protein (DUF58 family)
MPLAAKDLVDPVFFSRLESLELRARSIVEGFLHGMHRSPFIGFSVEFASHREYVPGDDPRHVNWKVYARTKRLYVKEFDAETNMNVHIVLDVSGSMSCAASGRSKLEYAASLAAAIAHLALKQHDAVGITIFADDLINHVAPRAKPHQLDTILQAIVNERPRPATNAGKALHKAAEMAKHRGMIVLISDFFDDLEAIQRGMDSFRFRNHEVLAFHIWDRWERDFPEDGNFRFRDLETGEEITARAEGVREHYLREVNRYREDIERICRNRAIDRIELTTDMPLDKALLDYLVKRSKSM